MKRTLISVLLTGLVALAVLAPGGAYAAQKGGKVTATATRNSTTYYYDFQTKLSPWVGGPQSSNTVPFLTLAYEPAPADMVGNGYAKLSASGTGPVWMVSQLPTASTSLAIKFKMRAVNGCGGCIPAIYAGYGAPADIKQFATLGSNLSTTWDGFQYKVNLPPVATAMQVYVAIGYIGAATASVAPSSVGVDDVTIVAFDNILPVTSPASKK